VLNWENQLIKEIKSFIILYEVWRGRKGMEEPDQQYEMVEIDLREYITVLFDRKWLILGIIIICLAASIIYSYILTDSVYQAQSTLLILPPQYTTSIEVGTLPIDTYRDLALSDDIKQQIISDLELETANGEPYTVGRLTGKMNIEIRGDYSSGEGREAQAPLLVLTVKGSNPERISKIANSWADKFIDASKEIRQGEVEEITTVINEQFKSTSGQLDEAKEELKKYRQEARLELFKDELETKENHLSQQTDKLMTLRTDLEEKKANLNQLQEEINRQESGSQWLGDLTNPKTSDNKEVTDLFTARDNYLTAQEELLSYRRNNKIDLLEQEIKIEETNLEEVRSTLASLKNELEEKQAERDKIANLLTEEPQNWELDKSLTEDAFWQEILNPAQIEALKNLTLSNEVINPIYQQLKQQLTDRRLAIESLPAQITYYESSIEDKEADIKDMKDTLEQREQEVSRLEEDLAHYKAIYKEHASLYESLKSDFLQTKAEIQSLEAEVAFYERNRRELSQEIKDLQDEVWTHANRIERLKQNVADLQRTYDMLAERREEARITKAERTHDVKFVAEAVPPTSPIGPNRRLNIANALVQGAMLGVFSAFTTEFIAAEKENE
jgi:uncharacterized protein involved in exopolysaccharide biosynthesis